MLLASFISILSSKEVTNGLRFIIKDHLRDSTSEELKTYDNLGNVQYADYFAKTLGVNSTPVIFAS